MNPPGKDSRNIFENLRAQRWTTSFYNVTGSRMEELSRQFKAGEINEKQLKEAVRELAKGYGKDIGIDFEVVYLDEKTMPKDSEGSTGSAYIVDKENKRVLIPIDVSKIGDVNELLGTLTEEISHGKDALEGRQDKKVAEDKSNDEEGLESLGRPANDYVKNKLGEDNNSEIKLSTDGIDLSNVDVGEKVGDVNTQDDWNSGYAETLSSQKDELWLNNMHFRLLKFKKGVNEFKYVVLGTSIKVNLMLFNPKDKTIRDFTLGTFSAGAEDLSLNTYKIPEKFKYNTLSYKYGELFGHSTMSALGILGNITGSGMQGGGTAAASVTNGISLIGAPVGVAVQTYSAGVTATSAINSAKVAYEIKAMKGGGGSSDNNSKEVNDDFKKEKKVEKNEKDEIKPYYETKKGNPKAKKYLEKSETLEQHNEKYAIENVKKNGINVGRSKEHTNTTIGHWEKMVDIAEEAKADPNVKAVYLDETLTNVSFEKFAKESKRPDVTIEYKDGTFKFIEVKSLTDDRVKLENKLRDLQTKYGKDVIKDFEVVNPKGGK